jgi:hypothetical protein
MFQLLRISRARLIPVVAVVGLATFAAGCGESGPYVHVNAINAYRGYDDFQPEKDKAVLAKAASVDARTAHVRIFQEAFPAGIELKEGTFGVAAGYKHHLIGKYAYAPGKVTPKTALVAHVKQLVVAADGDAAIILFGAVDEKDFDKAQGVEAIILRLDPRATPTDDKALPPAGNKSI